MENRKTVLMYCWGSVSEPMAAKGMEELGYIVITIMDKIKDYHADAEFAQKMITVLHAKKADLVFSYDYFPILSMICQMNGIPYISWIYDCPQYTLLSKTIQNPCNHIFCFDERYAQRIRGYGAPNVYHFPLAADPDLYPAKKAADPEETLKYGCDISFVGSLYNDDRNRILKADLSDFSRGYTEGLIRAQLPIYGCNLIADCLCGQAEKEIAERCGLTLGEMYLPDLHRMAADAVLMAVTAREREEVLFNLSEQFAVTLYTNSSLPACLKERERLSDRGTVDYRTQMPLVFYNSRINLNITSRTIETGVPQRVFDILSCGGFCLTNYQKEIGDLFEDGKELVMYTGMEDMVQKAGYYLLHEEERIRIAKAGYEKVTEHFTIRRRLKEMFDRING